MMTSDQVRQAFLDFFKEKEHKIIPSSSLIPKGDPTLLLTTAGMVQVKPYFLGEAKPPHTRLASCQKCFRTTDIEAVGDSTHLTFFEMLGNFSVGDYFKKEAIAWGWEFVTKWLKLPKERLWVTIFFDDDESFDYWLKTGVPEERILRFGEEDNFWGPAGDSGPCGPCSEIHYDFGEEVGCGQPDCKPNCDCGRFSEIWNLVFTQYNQDKEGKRTPLPKPNIDTGMGLERTVAAVNNIPSVYETEFFAHLIDNISKFVGKKYGSDEATDKAMRVVVEHGRAITFLIADGVMPSNEKRGYVLRRLLRRASLFGRRLGLEKPFLNQIAGATVGSMARVYPELQKNQNHIFGVVQDEEERFQETLKTGLELLNNIVADKETTKFDEISGEDAFRLYDTYGFPIELTKEIAQEQGLSVDTEGFEREMAGQRERGRKAQVRLDAILVKPTKFVGYTCLNQEAKIEEIIIGENRVDKLVQGKEAVIVLSETPFYGEMGGQVGDTGELKGTAGRFVVSDTVYGSYGASDATLHQGRVIEGSLSVGDEVEAIVDVERRMDIARNHTATHLLQFALRQVLGEGVWQRGSLVMAERFSFDFSYLKALTEKQVAEVKGIVNDKIRQNLKVYIKEMSYEEAKEKGAIALFGEKYGDFVRVVEIDEPPISMELCGGTHVSSTGEIGFFHIFSEHGIGAGLRRIEAVTGRGAEEYVNQRLADSQKSAQELEAELDKERKKALALEKELARKTAESLLAQAEVINGVKVLAAKVPAARMEIMREMSDIIRDKLKSAIVVLGTVYQEKPAFIAAVTPDLVEKGYNAGKIVKEVAGVAGGSGGGKPGLAQAGGKDKKKLDEALKLVKNLV